MKYNHKHYANDLKDPRTLHLKDRARFKNFYEELGKDPAQANQIYYEDQMSFVTPWGKIIELGCHSGFNLIHWAKQGYECVGVELSESLVELGKKRIAMEEICVQNRITLVNDWIEDFVPSEKYQTVVLTEVLEHVIDPLVVMRKAVECLASNGSIFISAPEKRTGTFSHVRAVGKSLLRRLLEQTNLTPISWEKNKLIARLK